MLFKRTDSLLISFQGLKDHENVTMDIIDDVLSNGDLQPRRSGIREDIFSFPQVQSVAYEDHGNHLYVIGAE